MPTWLSIFAMEVCALSSWVEFGRGHICFAVVLLIGACGHFARAAVGLWTRRSAPARAHVIACVVLVLCAVAAWKSPRDIWPDESPPPCLLCDLPGEACRPATKAECDENMSVLSRAAVTGDVTTSSGSPLEHRLVLHATVSPWRVDECDGWQVVREHPVPSNTPSVWMECKRGFRVVEECRMVFDGSALALNPPLDSRYWRCR